MQYHSVKGYTGWGQLGMLFVFVGLGFVLMSVIQLVIGMMMLPEGTSFNHISEEMMRAMKDPKNVNLSRLMQVLGTFSILFVPAVLFSWVCNGKNPIWLGFNKYINVNQVLIGFLLIFTTGILAAPTVDLIKEIIGHFPGIDHVAKKLENAYNEQVTVMSNLKSWPEFLLALLIMAFFPAMFEEVFFRGVMQNLLVKWWKKPVLAIIVVSVLFSLVHMSVYLFLNRAILGFVLGYMYYKTKNIWVNIIAHFLNNAIVVATMFKMSVDKKGIDLEKLDPKVEWWWGLVAAAILFFLFQLLTRYSEKNKMKIYSKEQALMVNSTTGNPFANSN